jgi:hypothetical protein
MASWAQAGTSIASCLKELWPSLHAKNKYAKVVQALIVEICLQCQLIQAETSLHL